MRARAAYIHSLGTTSILIASALLMLAIVSAIVAFRGWPAPGSSSDVPSVPLQPSAPARVAKVVSVPAPVSASVVAAGSTAAAVSRSVARRSGTAGLVKQVKGQGPATIDPTPHMAPSPVVPTHSSSPGQPGPHSQPGSPSPGGPGPAPLDQVTGTVQGLLPTVPAVPTGAGPGTGAPPALPRVMLAAYRVRVR